MNLFPALGNYLRHQAFAPQGLAPAPTGDADGRGRSQFPVTQDRDHVALSDAGKALAQQTVGDASSLLRRVGDLGRATGEAAKKFLANVVESLFGDAAKGMSLSFDSISVAASSSFSSALQYVQDGNGSSAAASLVLAEASHFVGKGTIATADGRRFSFEVEIQYESRLEVSASASMTSNASNPGNAGDGAARSGTAASDRHRHLQAALRDGLLAHFPGSVADLLGLFSQGPLELPFQEAGNDGRDAPPRLGSMKLHLLDMLADAGTMAAKLAKSYGSHILA